MADYRALCAELLTVFDSYDDESNLAGIFDDMKANKNDLLDRARAALAARLALAAEPEPPADGEVADPVIPGEYRGFNAIAYRNGFHAGHKHALTCAALAPQPELEGPTQDEIMSLAYEYFTFRGNSHRDSFFATSIETKKDPCASLDDFVRAVLARWGQ